MTGAELIKSLADDLEVTRARAEDILLSLRDLCIAEITAGKSFVFPGIGQLQQRRDSKAPRFRSAPELRQLLGLSDTRPIPGEMCDQCRKKPRENGRRKCSGCRLKNHRAKKNQSGRS